MQDQPIGPVLLAFFIAAFLKGITGLGFSTICLPILTTFIDLKTSIPLVIVPSLSSNVLVMIQAGQFRASLKRFWPLYLSAIPGLVIGVSILMSVQSTLSRALLGGILILYAVWAIRTQVTVLTKRAEVGLAPPVGFVTGLVYGMTGSQVMPIVPFLLSVHGPIDIFVQTINVSATLSGLIMLGLLGRVGLLSGSMIGTAVLGIIPVALGIFMGGQLRRKLPEEAFRNLVLLFLILMGLTLLLGI